MEEVKTMEKRVLHLNDFTTRTAENGNPVIEGYFAKFNQPYEVCSGWIETIKPGAFTDALRSGADVKVLWNHNSDIVLGCSSNNTATLREDNVGLWGSVEINQNDTDAMNAYERIKRRDVTGCSFGFEIKKFTEIYDDDGTYRTEIEIVSPLYEVSPCTFPAYESTEIHTRNKSRLDKAKSEFNKRQFETWKVDIQKKLRKEN